MAIRSSIARVIMLDLILLFTVVAVASASSRPNFVVVLTDDLDWTLGSANASTLKNTRRLMLDDGRGVLFPNWFAHTPVCCPSRAQLLTGRMFHNLRTKKVYEKKKNNCMHVEVENNASAPFYSDYYFAQYFANYTVGLFGKHLNTQNPTDFVPKGVDRMLINGGGAYLNPSFTWAGSKDSVPSQVKFDNCTGAACYSTSLIGNASLAWIEEHLQDPNDNRPFFSLISVKAPHIQDGDGFPLSIPAPWYQNTTIPEGQAPRTLNYNRSCPTHHWLVRQQSPLTAEQGVMVDRLYTTRLQTLLSVDDLMVDLFSTLEKHNVLDQTYILFTSDNGFRLGQFRIPQCKLHAYENDIRVPMMIRGPNLHPQNAQTLAGTHVDIMPTLLGLGTGDTESVPPTMDGRNLAADLWGHSTTPTPSLLVEYMSLGNVVRYQHLIDTYNHTFLALRVFHPGKNLKYVEYRDSRTDWDYNQDPLEIELFDLHEDPFEIINIADTASPGLLRRLQLKLARLARCVGKECRQELQTSWDDGDITEPETVESVIRID